MVVVFVYRFICWASMKRTARLWVRCVQLWLIYRISWLSASRRELLSWSVIVFCFSFRNFWQLSPFYCWRKIHCLLLIKISNSNVVNFSCSSCLQNWVVWTVRCRDLNMDSVLKIIEDITKDTYPYLCPYLHVSSLLFQIMWSHSWFLGYWYKWQNLKAIQTDCIQYYSFVVQNFPAMMIIKMLYPRVYSSSIVCIWKFQLQLNELRTQLQMTESEKSKLDEQMKLIQSDVHLKEVFVLCPVSIHVVLTKYF